MSLHSRLSTRGMLSTIPTRPTGSHRNHYMEGTGVCRGNPPPAAAPESSPSTSSQGLLGEHPLCHPLWLRTTQWEEKKKSN